MSIRLDVYIWKRVGSPLADTFYVTARYVVSGFGIFLTVLRFQMLYIG